jgi:hypothetical protein
MMLYVFFWVIPRRLFFICRHIKNRHRGITQKKTYSYTHVCSRDRLLYRLAAVDVLEVRADHEFPLRLVTSSCARL